MGRVTVRVVPGSGRTSVALESDRIVVRVRAAPERGKATEEARRALAEALGVPAKTVELTAGPRSRTKVFEVPGLDQSAAEVRLGAT